MRKIFTLFIFLLLTAAGVATAGEGRIQNKNKDDKVQLDRPFTRAISCAYQVSTGYYYVVDLGDEIYIDTLKSLAYDPEKDSACIKIIKKPGNIFYGVDNLRNIPLVAPYGIEIRGDSIYVADKYHNKVIGYSLIDSTVFMEIEIDTVNDLILRDICFGPGGMLYLASLSRGQIYRIDPESATFSILELSGDELYRPSGLYYEPEKNRMLVTAQRDSSSLIQAINFDSMYVTTLMNTGIRNLRSITKDLNRNVYFVSSYNGKTPKKYQGGVFRIDSGFTEKKLILDDDSQSTGDIMYNNYTDSIAVPFTADFLTCNFFEESPTLLYPTNNMTNLPNETYFIWSRVPKAESYYINLYTKDASNNDSLVSIDRTIYNKKIGLVDTTIYMGNLDIQEILTLGRTYTWHVEPCGWYNYTGNSSSTFTFTIADTLKPGPKAIFPPDSATGVNKGIVIEWSEVPGTEYYTFDLWTSDWGDWSAEYTTTVTSNTFSFRDYQFDKRYYWGVQAYGSNGGTRYSGYFFNTGNPALPQVQTDYPLPFQSCIPQSPVLKWHPVDSASKYIVRIGPGIAEYFYEVGFYEYFTVNAPDTTFQINEDLLLSEQYSWGVRATNDSGDGEWSEDTYFTIVDTVAGIPELLPLDFELIYPEFVWDDTGADSYNLEVALQNRDSYPYSDFRSLVINQAGIKDTKYKSTKALKKDTKYVWRVRGMYKGKYSFYSEPDLFTVGDPNSVEDAIAGEPIVSVIPNPVYDLAEIRLRGAGALQAEVYNSIGELVTILPAEKSGNENSLYLWNTKDITSGLYFIRFNIDGKVISKKVSVVR